MKLGYVIHYVADVLATVDFYERAFGLERRFVHESNLYAEMETGSSVLAFAAEAMAEMNGVAIRPTRPDEPAPAVEIAFIAPDPAAAYARAVTAGATPLVEPAAKPWGQIVGYVRDRNGALVEICSVLSG